MKSHTSIYQYFSAILIMFFASMVSASAQYYYKTYVLDKVDHELDEQAWKLYRGSNQLNYLEGQQKQGAQQIADKRAATDQQSKQNAAAAQRIAWQDELIQQQARINACTAQKIEAARASLAAESARVAKGSQDAETGLAALLKWRDQISQHHADNQASFKRMSELNTMGNEIVSAWGKANAEREVHLRTDTAKAEQKSENLDKREALLKTKLADLQECEPLVASIEKSQDQNSKSQKERLESQRVRREALTKRKAALDQRGAALKLQ
jgi:hypothetical protein